MILSPNRALRLAGLAGLLAPAPAFAGDISPWTPLDGGAEVEAAYIYQEADDFYAGDAKSDLPADLSQDTVTLSVSYGITDRLAVDVQTGYSGTDFIVTPGLSPNGGLDGLTDTVIGLRYKLLDETFGAPVTFTVGAAAIIEGDYETGALPAIGDGGSGAQFAVAAGKQIGPVSLSGDIGYRTRGNNIPDEIFGSAQIGAFTPSGFGVYGGLSFTDSTSGLDIGQPGFTPALFPQVEEDTYLWSVGASAPFLAGSSVNVTYGHVFEGRNTSNASFVRVGLGYSF
ncbi:hypothetical protein [Novosphingobium beihaiensis]|uniref:Uncharacterized protein n=1 Tax=Novosphingobium beihaiensis TaxID=2930389 RepID=A0ABT0BL72_9SPHN|nr:hypothetical protein [Novosphingobium beihaiensis]MCJ2185811.1 hypothetical protein [Novosphingobium beihaiensis]